MDTHICTNLLGLVTKILKAGKLFLYYYENYFKYKVEVSLILYLYRGNKFLRCAKQNFYVVGIIMLTFFNYFYSIFYH